MCIWCSSLDNSDGTASRAAQCRLPGLMVRTCGTLAARMSILGRPMAKHAGSLLRWARKFWPELLLIALGVFLRGTMAVTYDVRWGYDFPDHWAYIDWFLTRRELPPLSVSREAYHPPLFYLLSALIHGAGVPMLHMNVISIVCGSLRLAIIWFGLECNLAWNRTARLVALAVAAVLPAAVHTDGMVTNESLNNLLSAIAIVLMLKLLRSESALRWLLALALGLVVGLGLLTKISALALVGAGGVTAIVELCWVGHHGWRAHAGRFLPWVGALFVTLAVSGWYLAHNERAHGTMLLSGFDGLDAPWLAPLANTSYVDRRKANFFYGWTNDIYASPYYPTGVMPESYFWTPLVASTFVDYYSFGFAQRTPPVESYNSRPVPVRAAALSSFAVMGGTWIAMTTMIAWLVAAVAVWRSKNAGHLLILLVPLAALLGQLHFAVKFAVDAQGPIKGAYMQFAAIPLYGLFGLAVTWGWKRGWPGKLAIAFHGVALATVAIYCFYARLG